ncbi:MAG: comFC [Caulobacteraceae bacterium]|nr:comFC [Caulobacteraceae bacterium]
MQDLIFPHHDFDAGSRAASPGLSAQGWARVAFLEAPVCDGCGLPFDYDMGPGVRCPACEARPRAFARARAACLYDEASRDLILQFKHADRVDLARLFSLWLGRAGAELIAEADAVTPVPMHPLRLIRRRYNQAAEMARPLARRAGVAYWPGALQRKRAGESQAGKSGSGRRRNVAGAFVCPDRWSARVAGKRILLVDDVLTTGATAEACARALLKAGAKAVDVAVIARVREAGVHKAGGVSI